MQILEKIARLDTPSGISLEKIIFESQSGGALSTFNASIISLDQNTITPLDCHSDKECWIIVSGYGELICNGQKIALKPNDAIYYSPHDTHSVKNIGDDELKIISIWWD